MEELYRSENGIPDEIPSEALKPFGACAIWIAAADDQRWERHLAALKIRCLKNTTEHAIFED